jgi:hypothetical protein
LLFLVRVSIFIKNFYKIAFDKFYFSGYERISGILEQKLLHAVPFHCIPLQGEKALKTGEMQECPVPTMSCGVKSSKNDILDQRAMSLTGSRNIITGKRPLQAGESLGF